MSATIAGDLLMLTIGCLGAARITPVAMVQPAALVEGVRIAAVAARDGLRARHFADTHGIDRALVGYDALIADPAIDLVYNALPVHLHAEWSIKALEAGKHVLCEKPLAMNLDQARRMIACAQRNNRRLIEAFHYRYHPSFLHYLRWLSAGRIGRLQSIEAHFLAPISETDAEIRYLPDTGGGAGMDLGCYAISWLQMTTPEEPVSVECRAELTARGVDRRIWAEYRFPSGLRANLYASMAADERFDALLRVTGDTGCIEFNNPLAPHSASRLALQSRAGAERAPHDPRSTYQYQLEAVVSALRKQTSLPTEGDALVRQQDWLDQMYHRAGLARLR